MCYVSRMALDDTAHTSRDGDTPNVQQSAELSAGANQSNRGRPTVWNAKLEAAIIEDISGGCSERIAAEANGIAYSTFRAHRAESEEFSARCQAARAQGIRARITEYRTTDDPVRAKVCHHWLAVKDRDEWADTQKIEHSGNIAISDLFAKERKEVALDGDTPD